jgi:uncharacterized protein with PIN domain
MQGVRMMPRCPACKKRVRGHQCAIVLTNLPSGRRRTYHVTEACVKRAFVVLYQPGAIYHWAIRTPDGNMN